MIEIVENNGAIHTNPEEIKIIRNERTEQFFQILENYEPEHDNI